MNKLFTIWLVAIILTFLLDFKAVFADTFLLDIKLERDPILDAKITTPVDFHFSNNSEICPSNQCKIIFEPEILDNYLFVDGIKEGDSISAYSAFRLNDDITNGHFTPKKQALIERYTFDVTCPVTDIQEDLQKGITKYLCFDGNAHFDNNVNKSKTFQYAINATFETPSQHLVVHGYNDH